MTNKENKGITLGFQEKEENLTTTGDKANNKADIIPTIGLNHLFENSYIKYVVNKEAKTTITEGPTGLKLKIKRKGAII